MGSEENVATDSGAASSIDQSELYSTIYAATKDAMLVTMSKLIYLSLAAFLIYGGVQLAVSNSGTSSVLWGAGVSFTGFLIAAFGTGAISLPRSRL
jgi:hypothetical protein